MFIFQQELCSDRMMVGGDADWKKVLVEVLFIPNSLSLKFTGKNYS